jgi:hypothetical protein
MIKEIEKIVMENGPRWEIPFFPPRSLFFIKTCGSKNNSSQQPVVFLVFDQRGPTPRWVVKASRHLSTTSTLQKEYQQLLYFYHTLSPAMRKTIPRPLLSREDSGRFLFVETGLPGEGFPTVVGLEKGTFHRKQIGRFLHQVKEWLLQFQKETQEGDVEITDEWIDLKIRPMVDQYRSLYPCTPEEEVFFSEYLEGWRPYFRTRIPVVACHGDFWAGNMLMEGETLSVFDWTFSKRKALPFDDLLLFISSFLVGPSEREEGDNNIKSFEKMFFSGHWFSQQVGELVSKFFFHHKLSPRMIFQIFPLFLIKMAIRKEDEYHIQRNPFWRDRLAFYIQNRNRFIEI